MTRTAISITVLALALTGISTATLARPHHPTATTAKANAVTAQLNQQQTQGAPIPSMTTQPGQVSIDPAAPDATTGDQTTTTLPPATSDTGANAYVNPDATTDSTTPDSTTPDSTGTTPDSTTGATPDTDDSTAMPNGTTPTPPAPDTSSTASSSASSSSDPAIQ